MGGLDAGVGIANVIQRRSSYYNREIQCLEYSESCNYVARSGGLWSSWVMVKLEFNRTSSSSIGRTTEGGRRTSSRFLRLLSYSAFCLGSWIFPPTCRCAACSVSHLSS